MAPPKETVVAERAKMAAPHPRSRGTERNVYGAVDGVCGRVGRERPGGLWAPEEAPWRVGERVGGTAKSTTGVRRTPVGFF